MQLLWSRMGNSKVSGYTYTGLNKIITNNLSKYSRFFSQNEISNILLALKKTDMIIKSTSINNIILFIPTGTGQKWDFFRTLYGSRVRR